MKITLEWPMYYPSADGKDEAETLFDVTVDICSFGDPGKISGPPEKCYPPEGPELEIIAIEIRGIGKQPGISLDQILWPMLGFNDKVQEAILDKALENASDNAKAAAEAAAEDAADARRDSMRD